MLQTRGCETADTLSMQPTRRFCNSFAKTWVLQRARISIEAAKCALPRMPARLRELAGRLWRQGHRGVPHRLRVCMCVRASRACEELRAPVSCVLAALNVDLRVRRCMAVCTVRCDYPYNRLRHLHEVPEHRTYVALGATFKLSASQWSGEPLANSMSSLGKLAT